MIVAASIISTWQSVRNVFELLYTIVLYRAELVVTVRQYFEFDIYTQCFSPSFSFPRLIFPSTFCLVRLIFNLSLSFVIFSFYLPVSPCSSLSLYLCLSGCLSPSYFATETFPGRFGGGGVGGGGVESIHHSLGFWPDLATIKNRLSQNKGSDSQHSIEEYRNCTKWEAIDLRISRLSQENGFSSVAGSRVGRRQAISRSARHPKSRDRVKISRDRVAANCELREMRHQWWRQKPRNFFFQSCRVL